MMRKWRDWIFPLTAPSSLSRQRSDLICGKTRAQCFENVWPEYNNHGNDSGSYFGALFPQHAHVQILLFDRSTEQVVARGRTIPFRWDGSLGDLPHGIDAVGLRALDGLRRPTSLSALAAEVAVDHQRRGRVGSYFKRWQKQPVRRSCLPSLHRFALLGRIGTRSFQSSGTRTGNEVTRCLSTLGCECTPDWVRPS